MPPISSEQIISNSLVLVCSTKDGDTAPSNNRNPLIYSTQHTNADSTAVEHQFLFAGGLS